MEELSKLNKGLFTSRSDEWETPQDFFNQLDKEFNFNSDVCATHENTKCKKYFTKKNDALKQDWKGVCSMNPPYGRQIGGFVKKAYEESLKGSTIVGLMPARTDTKYFHNYIYHKAEIRFLKGRIKFINRTLPSYREDRNFKSSPAPFPSMVVIWRFVN